MSETVAFTVYGKAAPGEVCKSLSPIYKGDEGKVQCERLAGHDGEHEALEPPEHRVVGQPIYWRRWSDDA